MLWDGGGFGPGRQVWNERREERAWVGDLVWGRCQRAWGMAGGVCYLRLWVEDEEEMPVEDEEEGER